LSFDAFLRFAVSNNVRVRQFLNGFRHFRPRNFFNAVGRANRRRREAKNEKRNGAAKNRFHKLDAQRSKSARELSNKKPCAPRHAGFEQKESLLRFAGFRTEQRFFGRRFAAHVFLFAALRFAFHFRFRAGRFFFGRFSRKNGNRGESCETETNDDFLHN
jgi:hypothetical protein